jgi:phosphatidate cytidylyltransferase
MIVKRILGIVVLAAIGLPAVYFGGLYFYSLVVLILGVAAWEYWRMFRIAGFHASAPIVVGGVVILATLRAYALLDQALLALAALILASMAWHVIDYEKGRDQAATDFAFTVTGLLYLGWIGAYLIDLRNLPDGLWWMMLVLPIIWIADVMAFLVGIWLGRHQLTRRVSPRKTWEGYIGGVVFATLGGAGLAALWESLSGPQVSILAGAVLGALLSILTLLGDLGESLLKRQAGVKDSGNLIPGHGGAFDRIDSWLWGAVLGYFFIRLFLL